jgi:AhpD family alkylhydroperoxidase
MQQPLDYNSIAPEVLRPQFTAGTLVRQSGLPPKLLTLVEIRASQINGCAFCLALHAREADAAGETRDRIMGLPAWREASWYDERERAALEWTEALTRMSERRPDEDLLARMRRHFDDKELVYLTLAINTIDSWNRFNVGFHTPPERAEEVFAQLYASAK